MKLSVFNMHRPAQDGYTGETPPNPSDPGGGASAGTGRPSSDGLNRLTVSLRQRLLNRLLAATTGLTWLLYLLALPGWFEDMGGSGGQNSVSPILPMVVYGVIAIGLSALTLAQRILSADRAYPLRAGGFLILLLGAGGFMLASQGLIGNGRLLLALFPLLAVFLLAEGRFARLVRFAALVLSIFTMVTIGFFAVQGYLLTQDTGAEAWLIAELGFGLITIVSTLTFDAYLHEMESGIEKSQLFSFNLEHERQTLEAQIRQAKIDLEYRLQQVRSANEINKRIRVGGGQESVQPASSAQPTAQLFAQVCDQVKNRFGYDAVRIYLVEPNGQHALLAAETGEADPQVLAEGSLIPLNRQLAGHDSLIGWVIANQQTRINRRNESKGADTSSRQNSNAAESAVNSTETAVPPFELALPILGSQNEPGVQTVLGAMMVQSRSEAAFSKDEVVLLESIAGSLASALTNKRLVEQIDSNLEEISALHRQYLRRAWMQVLDTRGPQEYQYVSIMHPEATSGRERQTGPILMGSGSGEAALSSSDSRQRAENLLELPIQLRDQVIGSLVLEPEAGHPIGEQERILIESVINQAALALENARLLDETRQRADQEMITAGISTRIWSSTDIEMILQTALNELGTSLNAVQGSIELWPEPVGLSNKGSAVDSDGGDGLHPKEVGKGPAEDDGGSEARP